jgi:hypothetical protein
MSAKLIQRFHPTQQGQVLCGRNMLALALGFMSFESDAPPHKFLLKLGGQQFNLHRDQLRSFV